MTREEIIRAWKDFDAVARKRYWDAGCSIDASLDAPLALAAWVRRATLEEAARAVCRNCDAEVPLLCNEHGEWVHYDDDGSGQCDAGPIHDLIAALDKEAK